ncbi:14428_t:CDS:2, partial [Rhizophagus irregularis]
SHKDWRKIQIPVITRIMGSENNINLTHSKEPISSLFLHELLLLLRSFSIMLLPASNNNLRRASFASFSANGPISTTFDNNSFVIRSPGDLI